MEVWQGEWQPCSHWNSKENDKIWRRDLADTIKGAYAEPFTERREDNTETVESRDKGIAV